MIQTPVGTGHTDAGCLIRSRQLQGELHDREMQGLNLIDAQKGKVVAHGYPEWKTAIWTACQRANAPE